MAPFDEPHHIRWQRQAKRAFGATLPDWTIADDSDDYDVHIMKKRPTRPRVRRSNVPTSPREPEVMINILREPYAKRTDTVDPATEKQKQDAKKEESSDSESEGDDAADSGSESESEDEDEEPKKSKEDQTSNDGNLNIKLPASSTNTPSVDAPSAEGSMSDSPLVESGDGGIHSNVHKILLGVGSVGGFLFLLGIGFLIWKFYSRKQTPKKPAPIDDMNFDKPSRFENLVSKVPFLGPRYGHKGWYTIEDPSYSPPSYSPPLAEKTRPQSPLFMSKQSDNFLTVPSLPFGVYRTTGDRRTGVTNYDIDAVSPTSTTFVESAVEVQVVARHDPKDSLSTPYKPQQHKRIPSTTPYAYDVGRRQTGVSELSSISSGFGDGDIVVTPTTQTVQSVPSRPEPSRQPTWKSTNSVGRRDTVSTVASVDTRPRFRSVNSWVKQQNGQLRRAQRQQENSLDSDAPPVPPLAPPPEQDFRYMLQDDERPRPVEMV
ncbi:uncharacterized protein FFUJ_09574 [Fusarium fujikuroi IMI 58289]|uniref:Uncharacterized protein n=1 Tax=Gibberella fujikuroi (strain CBS 195.34 / IMI 58289 / NRRL A-6831) TaxID=1279085 RepID=S0EG50_GIBF5|nr:uncharacterized protein FFUJ_09574 [Fusarium fujikuroi IMI 58289]KLP16397.1 uncharacterized protein LW94_4677 [Fusarium fujikuroi]QGI86603.1 hypothetical protein CEK25_013332 [Fusarium fujikuroi]CCT73620.1 uncharacterized protein FFUJ_09574 [Fusarium fujikuroi IMI 58289]SCO10358.1 uncharacterized protein FFM5_09814 [Fusarium fujikuroi]SCO55953.1 uncharacterized protein FFMR_13109 [Fusarium fujikuroi]